MDRKAQIWTMDLILGIVIFLVIIVVYFIFTSNISEYGEASLDGLYSNSLVVSNSLMSSGSPTNWNSSNVIEIGLTDGNSRLNYTKVKHLDSLNYDQSKILLKSKYDYLIFFKNNNDNIINLNGTTFLGKAGLTDQNIQSTQEPNNLVSSNRILIYNSEIIIMVVYLWQ